MQLSGHPARKSIFLLIGLLALVLSLPAITRLGTYAASGSGVSMSYTVKAVGSQPMIFVTLAARDSQFPSQVVVTMVSYYDGSSSPFNSQHYVVATGPQGGLIYIFSIPYQGSGNYLFVGSVYNAHGVLLMQASIDPLIEPEWK